MPADRDQQTPVDEDDAERLARHRGQGTGGSGEDLLPGEPGSLWDEEGRRGEGTESDREGERAEAARRQDPDAPAVGAFDNPDDAPEPNEPA